jgi:pseudaminic acid biosynthesis-associated methylase
MDELHARQFGVTRRELNRRFLDTLDREARILEVGTNVGVQLALLSELGFRDMVGVDVQFYALDQAGRSGRRALLVQASAFALPFPDASFDLVFTSGVLIHLSPETIGQALAEIHRCSSRFVWGWEYYAARHVEVSYRNRRGLLWKGDFAGMYREQFPELRCVREERLPYLESDNVDSMFLLEKKGKRVL